MKVFFLKNSSNYVDKNEKNEINLYTYLKNIIAAIQSAIGNINNFELHVDPTDSKTRIIDINYTQLQNAKGLFSMQIQNTNSIVRTYTLQSQIFPEQGTIIAISAQAKGGQLGMQNNTLIDFNRKLTDRIISEKLSGNGEQEPVINNNTIVITNGIGWIIKAFASLDDTNNSENVSNINSLFSSAKNSLKELIAYAQSISTPKNSRNIIPTKFSFEIDGIGGLVIGHMFKLPDDTLPKGYKGEGYGSELGQVITKIGHSISKGDWVTRVETLNVVLDASSNPDFLGLKLDYLLNPNTEVAITEEAKELVEKTINTPLSPISPEDAGMKETNAKKLEKKLFPLNIRAKYGATKLSELENNGDIDPTFANLMYDLLYIIRKDNPTANIELTGGNDIYHKTRGGKHPLGKGLDFTVKPERVHSNVEENIVNFIEEKRRQGIKLSYLNEYENLSEGGTGGHFHIQLM